MGRDGWEREGRLRVEVAVLGTREQVRDAGVLQERGALGGIAHPSGVERSLLFWACGTLPRVVRNCTSGAV